MAAYRILRMRSGVKVAGSTPRDDFRRKCDVRLSIPDIANLHYQIGPRKAVRIANFEEKRNARPITFWRIMQ